MGEWVGVEVDEMMDEGIMGKEVGGDWEENEVRGGDWEGVGWGREGVGFWGM